jgi:hypothetical protein
LHRAQQEPLRTERMWVTFPCLLLLIHWSISRASIDTIPWTGGGSEEHSGGWEDLHQGFRESWFHSQASPNFFFEWEIELRA